MAPLSLEFETAEGIYLQEPPDTRTPGFDRENELKPPETVKISAAIKPLAGMLVLDFTTLLPGAVMAVPGVSTTSGSREGRDPEADRS